jgi:DNA-binding transcriptional MerR regulator
MHSTTDDTITIGELANEFDITARAIRFYEEQGLLHPIRNGQQRIYYAKDRIRLTLILRGKRLGFSLAEIKNVFALYDTNPSSTAQLEKMLTLTEQKRLILELQLNDIQTVLSELNEVERRCREELLGLNHPVIGE